MNAIFVAIRQKSRTSFLGVRRKPFKRLKGGASKSTGYYKVFKCPYQSSLIAKELLKVHTKCIIFFNVLDFTLLSVIRANDFDF